jgi:hypothetical protein
VIHFSQVVCTDDRQLPDLVSPADSQLPSRLNDFARHACALHLNGW